MDRRIRKSQKAIESALIKLMKEKSFEEITINAIATKADVSRGTIYLNYDDKYCILEKIIDKELEKLVNSCNPNESSDINEQGLLLRTLEYIEANSSTFITLLADEYDILFMGDTPYTLNHMSIDEVRQITLGGEETEKQLDSTRKLQQLVEDEPNTVMLFAHDYTSYQKELIEQFLEDGYFNEEELNNIRNYRFTLFDNDWKLKPGHMPYYIPPAKGQETGSVGFK